MFSSKVRGMVKLASKISQDNYPEQLGQLMIVNAPWAFTATWTVIKGFIDEKTRAKVMLYGSSYKKELDKYVAND